MHEALKEKLGKYLLDPGKLDENTPEKTMLVPNRNDHVYFDPKKPESEYVSVTTVLSAVAYNAHIVQWANSLGFRRIQYKDELDRTAKAGTALHLGAQWLVDPDSVGEKPKLEDPLMDYYMRKRMERLKMRLDAEQPWRTLFTEQTFFSKKYGIAGTIDWFTEFRGAPTIGDFKSASSMRDKFIFQLGGYSILLDENGIEWEKAMIVMAKEDNCVICHFPKHIILQAQEMFLRVKDYCEDHDLVNKWVHDRQYLLLPPTMA